MNVSVNQQPAASCILQFSLLLTWEEGPEVELLPGENLLFCPSWTRVKHVKIPAEKINELLEGLRKQQ